MLDNIGTIGIMSLGAILGLVLGYFFYSKVGLTPSAKAYKEALEAQEENIRILKGRYNARLKEINQPSELQRIASLEGSTEDLVTQFSAILPSLPIPKWLRPFAPQLASGIAGWAKEHPEQIQSILQKLTQGPNNVSASKVGFEDSL